MRNKYTEGPPRNEDNIQVRFGLCKRFRELVISEIMKISEFSERRTFWPFLRSLVNKLKLT